MPDVFDPEFNADDINLESNLVEVDADVNIMAKDPALHRVLVAMGWDINAFDADALDLDVSCFLLDKDGQTRVDEDFVFYNNADACEGGVLHNGDSRTGAGEGDDESIMIDLHKIPFDVVRVLFCLSVDRGLEKQQNLGMLRKAYIRVVNEATSHEILRYDLDAHVSEKTDTGMIVAALDREGPKWRFKTMAEFLPGGLAEVATRYGIIIQGN